MLAKSVATALAVSAVLLASSVAHADEPAAAPIEGPSEAPAPKTESRWYGYQTLSSDAAAIAFVAIGAASDSKPVQNVGSVMGLATYAIAPVVIHGLHGHAGKGVGDAAIRVFTPLLGAGIGALVGLAAFKPSNEPTVGGVVHDVIGPEVATIEGGLIGGLIGVGTAIAIDAAVLTHEEVPVEKKERGVAIHPNAGPTRDGFMAGVGGTF